jgi:hypothetical protein
MSITYYVREAKKRQLPSAYVQVYSPAADGCYAEYDIAKPILWTVMCDNCLARMTPSSIVDRSEAMCVRVVRAEDDTANCFTRCPICQHDGCHCREELAADCARAIFCAFVVRELVGQDVARGILEWLVTI